MKSTEDGYLIDVVGGAEDGQVWQLNYRPKVEDAVFRFSGTSSDRYVFESDEKFHFYGIAPPPVHDLPEERFTQLKKDVDNIIGQMKVLADQLSETFRAAGGCDQSFDLNFWELRPNYRLIQQIVDTEGPLIQTGHYPAGKFW